MEADKLYDVGIIGGGLAGLCLSIQCIRNGHSVILIEKETYPFHKVCGEYISNESLGFLKNMGVDIDNLLLPNISRLQVSDNRGKCFQFPLDMGGFGISRYMLDDILYKVALTEGVKILTGTKVTDVRFNDEKFTVHSQNQVIHAKVVAGCFGKRSNLDVKWKRDFALPKHNAIKNYVGIKYHVRYNHPSEQISLHNFKDGYCGLSKIEDGKSCLCYLTTADNLKRCNNSIAQMEHEILCKNERLKEIFSESEFLYTEPLAISQISFQKKNPVENYILMIGDSAGLITPLCGNGMSMAMYASKMAAKEISLYLTNKISRIKMEKNYSNAWKAAFANRLFIGRNVQRMFGRNFTTSLFLRGITGFPALSKLVIRSTHGNSF